MSDEYEVKQDIELPDDEIMQETTPEFVYDLLCKWEDDTDEYNFDVRLENANTMEKINEKYKKSIDDEKDIEPEELFEGKDVDGELIVRKTKPRDEVIVYFVGTSEYNRYAICETVGLWLEGMLLNRVTFGETLSVGDADDTGDGLFELFGG